MQSDRSDRFSRTASNCKLPTIPEMKKILKWVAIVASVPISSLTLGLWYLRCSFLGKKLNDCLPIHHSTTEDDSPMEGYSKAEDFDGFDNEIGLPSGKNIVPNIVHFIIWKYEISFVEAICLLAAVINQKPDHLYIHTDRELSGKYWNLLNGVDRFKKVVKLLNLYVLTVVFGQQLNSSWKYFHGSDVARLQILAKHGGIFLETDTFLVKSFEEFRKFEMSLGWQTGDYLANQAIVAHKNARFLHKWLASYQDNYKSDEWYYNSREYPTTEILVKQPYLIRRMTSGFCEGYLQEYLFLENNSTWSDHYAIHLSLRKWTNPPEPTSWIGLDENLSTAATYPVIFNETNIYECNCTLRQMVLSVIGFMFKKPLIENAPQYEIVY